MAQVQGSWLPPYDRNPQKFVENIFQAKEGVFSLPLGAFTARQNTPHTSAFRPPPAESAGQEPGRRRRRKKYLSTSGVKVSASSSPLRITATVLAAAHNNGMRPTY